MSERKIDDGATLPIPVALTPEEVQRIAAGVASMLPPVICPGRTLGIIYLPQTGLPPVAVATLFQ